MTSCAFSVSEQDVILVINSTEELLQVLLVREGMVLGSEFHVGHDTSMALLAPAVRNVLRASCRARPHGVAVVRGPGALTGIRIGLATALGFARGWNIPVAGLELPALLVAGLPVRQKSRVCVALHARRGQVVAQWFNPDRTPQGPPGNVETGCLAEQLRNTPNPLLALGSGIRRNAPLLPEAGEHLNYADPIFDAPSPAALAAAALAAVYGRTLPVPLYLRLSDAEQNLKAIAAQKGLSLSVARDCLAQGEKSESSSPEPIP